MAVMQSGVPSPEDYENRTPIVVEGMELTPDARGQVTVVVDGSELVTFGPIRKAYAVIEDGWGDPFGCGSDHVYRLVNFFTNRKEAGKFYAAEARNARKAIADQAELPIDATYSLNVVHVRIPTAAVHRDYDEGILEWEYQTGEHRVRVNGSTYPNVASGTYSLGPGDDDYALVADECSELHGAVRGWVHVEAWGECLTSRTFDYTPPPSLDY